MKYLFEAHFYWIWCEAQVLFVYKLLVMNWIVILIVLGGKFLYHLQVGPEMREMEVIMLLS